MDRKLVAWARAVKARNRAQPGALPPLWLFTDRVRVPDPLVPISHLPKGLAGLVLRGASFDEARRAALLCRSRGLTLAIASDARLAARHQAGLHASGGRWRRGPRPWFVTSSAHSQIQCRRAQRAGAAIIFLSPVFPTQSHPEAVPLGVARWAALARRNAGCVAALGGVNGASVRRLPRWCRYVGAIGSLIDP